MNNLECSYNQMRFGDNKQRFYCIPCASSYLKKQFINFKINKFYVYGHLRDTYNRNFLAEDFKYV